MIYIYITIINVVAQTKTFLYHAFSTKIQKKSSKIYKILLKCDKD